MRLIKINRFVDCLSLWPLYRSMEYFTTMEHTASVCERTVCAQRNMFYALANRKTGHQLAESIVYAMHGEKN